MRSTIFRHRADVAGTFRILLNWSNGIGKLLDLDDQLVNVAYASYSPSSGIALQPANPPYRDYGIIPPYSLIQSPLPAGRFNYQNGVGHLISDPSGFGLSYDITFGLNQASLNIVIPTIDNYITVTNAPRHDQRRLDRRRPESRRTRRSGRLHSLAQNIRPTIRLQPLAHLLRHHDRRRIVQRLNPRAVSCILATLAAAALFTTRARKRRVLASCTAIN